MPPEIGAEVAARAVEDSLSAAGLCSRKGSGQESMYAPLTPGRGPTQTCLLSGQRIADEEEEEDGR